MTRSPLWYKRQGPEWWEGQRLLVADFVWWEYEIGDRAWTHLHPPAWRRLLPSERSKA